MRTLKYKNQFVTILHLLFWILSFNLFNSFFSRGIESSHVLDGFELTEWNVLFISNIIVAFLIVPIIWFIRGIKRGVKYAITAIPLILLVWAAIRLIYTGQDMIIVPLILGFFLNNFLYVMIFHITIICVVYLNINVLINRYLTKGKFGLYLIGVSCLIVIAGVLNFALFDFCIDVIFPQLFFISWFKVWELILIMSGYLAITTIVFLLWQYALMLVANREKAINELSALKAQINPHFLFNNLNTIYALAEKGDLRTKEVILQLSDFLRYVLYDTSSEKIELEKEVEIIKTYVGLQTERINKNTTEIILNVDGDFSGVYIAPLLLLPLAENCFKHGIGNEKGTIQIDILYSGHQLCFCTKNPIERRENPLNHEQGGIGILNVEKRLNLLYPEKHLLTFSEEGNLFKAEMKIDLD